MDVITQEAWILDGNFDDERKFVWSQADCIVWLDYSLPTIFRRVVSRNFQWVITRQPVWSDNRMTLQRAVSGVRHAIASYATKRQNYPLFLAEFPGVIIYRFHTSRETETWFQSLRPNHQG